MQLLWDSGCGNWKTYLPSDMKTMSMGGVSKKVMGLVVSIRIMDEATTAQLQDTSMVKHKKKTISTYLKNNQKRSVNYYPSNRLSKMCTQYLDFLSMLQLLFLVKLLNQWLRNTKTKRVHRTSLSLVILLIKKVSIRIRKTIYDVHLVKLWKKWTYSSQFHTDGWENHSPVYIGEHH